MEVHDIDRDSTSSETWSLGLETGSEAGTEGTSSIGDHKLDDSHSSIALVTNSKRLWHDVHFTAQWGAIPGNQGLARLTLSDEDKRVRDYFITEARELGCEIKVDQMGNIFAVLPGENNDLPPIGMGSHLDTQPAGGRYDGILGVLGALEVLRTVKDSGILTYAPLAAINWTNEEGARFTPGCSGSAVWASHTSIFQAHSSRDVASTCTFEQELRRIGYYGTHSAEYLSNPLSAHFELHIEQRRRLQDEHKQIGIVTNIQGIRWYRIFVHGQRAHAGSTPMDDRADAMVAAADLILFLDERARQVSAVATAGVVDLDRPSSNTVPGEVEFTLDLRHPSEEVLNDFETSFLAHASSLSMENPKIRIDMKNIWHSPAVQLDEAAVSCSRRAAEKVVGEGQFINTISLAGHDSALTAIRVPTSMIFVPSKDGISHAPEEFTSEEECGTGVQVLLQAVLEYDQILSGIGDKESIVVFLQLSTKLVGGLAIVGDSISPMSIAELVQTLLGFQLTILHRRRLHEWLKLPNAQAIESALPPLVVLRSVWPRNG
ncbi:N-carbamoyl-L-amino-acid hydrolase [Paramyrothecium foliicola]|nr:N-carbamoyl-L-amino-acid hydrolase [Paramyrothecium foliicola]